MKNLREQKAITLVALTVTIAILFILAAVSIRTFSGGEMIEYAQNVTDNYAAEQEKDALQVKILKWQTLQQGTLEEFLKKEYGESKVQVDDQNNIIVELKSGKKYMANESGEVTFNSGNNQNSELITFSVVVYDYMHNENPEGDPIAITTTFQAERGMTFNQWVASKYNTAGATLEEYGDYMNVAFKDTKLGLEDNGWLYGIIIAPINEYNPEVSLEITPGGVYYPSGM